VEYVEEQQSIQIISQIFIDDLESLIRQRYDENITLAGDEESDMVDYYIERYLKEKILIDINGSATKFSFLGKEYKDDITYCYLEIPNISKINTFTITNDVLFDLYKEQQNIVRTKINGKNKSFILISGNNKGVLNFN
ncbi:MAG: DUF6702 family protein, partial [Bacteroidota bacterium]